MKIAAAPRAATRSKGRGVARSGDSLASIGRPGFIKLVLPEEQGPKLRAGKGRAGGFEP